MQRATRAGLIALALLFAAGEATAQFGGGMPGGGFPGGGRRGGMRGGGGGAEKRSAPEQTRVDTFQTTLEELRIDLHMDAAQQAAWNTYADRLAALLSDQARERARAAPAASPQTAPQQLDQLVMSAQNRATALEDVAAAAKALYATLNPEQKTVADGRLAHVTSMALSPPAGRTAR